MQIDHGHPFSLLAPLRRYRSSADDSCLDPPRTVYLQRTHHHDIGIKLCGGNATGVFVAQLSPNSPALNSDLKIGDQILEINGRNLRNGTAEAVAVELNRPAETLEIVVQYNMGSE